MAFDVDGTLTDGGILISAGGELFKRFSVRDGLGLVLLQQAGIRVALVTGRHSEIVTQRARELKIETVLQGVADKAQAMRDLCEQEGLTLEQAGFMGDDWPDLPAMQVVGFAATVPDADTEVRRIAHFVASVPAGAGAARPDGTPNQGTTAGAGGCGPLTGAADDARTLYLLPVADRRT
jgi:3-deoxy-D-manno-octulosonate 8-phosphate phosphatase (KDO 8-P phosphatase)